MGFGFAVVFFSGGSRFTLGLLLNTLTKEVGWTKSSLAEMGLIALGRRRPVDLVPQAR